MDRDMGSLLMVDQKLALIHLKPVIWMASVHLGLYKAPILAALASIFLAETIT